MFNNLNRDTDFAIKEQAYYDKDTGLKYLEYFIFILFKDVAEENIIKGFQKDCEKILIVHQKFDLDNVYCKKCEFKAHSERLLRIYKLKNHQSNQTFETFVEGFRSDLDNTSELWKKCERMMMSSLNFAR